MYRRTDALSYLTSIELGSVGTSKVQNTVKRGNGFPSLLPVTLYALGMN
jgi:hypothetical protein